MLAQGVAQIATVVTTAVLARLLTPEEYGLIALAHSLLAATSLLSAAGINAALVTRQGDEEPAASSYFWVAAGLGLIVVALLASGSGPLTSLLGQPQAGPYLAVLSLSFMCSVLALVPNALLQRRLKFGLLNAALITMSVSYAVTAIVLALAGLGAWSVIVAQVGSSAAALVFSLVAARWFPRPRFQWAAVAADLRFTWGLGANQGFTYVLKNVDYWATSIVLGGAALGIYYVAYVVPNIVRLRISAVVRQVMLPVYASTSDSVQIAAFWRRTIPVMVGWGLPALAGIALVAEPLVNVLLGDQWESAVVPMQILAVVAALDLLLASAGTVAIAKRWIRPVVLLSAFRVATTAAFATAAALVWASLEAVATGVALSALMTLLLQELFVSRPMGVSLRTVLPQLRAYVGLTAVMAVFVILANQLLPPDQPAIVRLLVLVAVGAGAYVTAGYALAREQLEQVLSDARGILRGR